MSTFKNQNAIGLSVLRGCRARASDKRVVGAKDATGGPLLNKDEHCRERSGCEADIFIFEYVRISLNHDQGMHGQILYTTLVFFIGGSGSTLRHSHS